MQTGSMLGLNNRKETVVATGPGGHCQPELQCVCDVLVGSLTEHPQSTNVLAKERQAASSFVGAT